MKAGRTVLWVLRVLWAALPLTAGPALAAGLDGRSGAVQLTAAIVLWAGWAAVLIATLVPYPVGLTALRLIAPAGLVAVVTAVLGGEPSSAAAIVGVMWMAAATAVAFLPDVGVVFVNGPSYANERRYPLRVPGLLVAGPLELAWLITLGAPLAGLLLLAARAWVAGVIVLVVGTPIAVILARALHGLARRWVVFVPAGLVLHDPMTITDPVLFERPVIESLHPAPAGSDSLDLTQRAAGLALELVLRQKVPLTLVKPGNRTGDAGLSARLLFTPTRPGAVLADASSRRIPVG